MKKQKLIVFIFWVALACSVVSGCRTAHGFGEDMENAGDKIQEGTSK